MKKVLFSILFLALLGVVNSPALADSYGQYGQYGAGCSSNYGDQCNQAQIKIDKKIQISTKGGNQFVDSLSINESRLTKGQKVTFQISVYNSSDSELKNVQVQDIFPELLTFVSGTGSYDANTRTLSFSIDSLKSKETKKYLVVGKVKDPTNVTNGSVCVVNQSMATTQNGETEQDNASFCIEKSLAVLPAPKMTQTPATGPEMLSLMGLIPAAGLGFLLRRKSK